MATLAHDCIVPRTLCVSCGSSSCTQNARLCKVSYHVHVGLRLHSAIHAWHYPLLKLVILARSRIVPRALCVSCSSTLRSQHARSRMFSYIGHVGSRLHCAAHAWHYLLLKLTTLAQSRLHNAAHTLC